MPARATLKVTQGRLEQPEYVFDERTSCIIGRSRDCRPRIPNEEPHLTISRAHCLLDINPPDVRVRDFGSLNGTYVNGIKIGQREKGMTAEEAAGLEFPEHDLKDGDEIRIGKVAFRVSIYVPATCAYCSAEIPEDRKAAAEVRPGVYQCDACRAKARAEEERRKKLAGPAARRIPRPAPRPRGMRCAMCGRDVSGEVGARRHGVYLCASCRADPRELIRQLLGLARSGRQDLVSIKGYSILKELGRGGMGAVYLAQREKSSEQVALKVMLPKVPAGKHATEMFMREIEISKHLKHRNVVQLKDAGCSDGTFFFTLEFCEGGSVDKLVLARGSKLSVGEAGKIILDVLDGLEYAHNAKVSYKLKDGKVHTARGVVHRDLSPQNIFLHGTGGSRTAKLGDYGLSKAFDLAGLSGQTRTGVAAGKPLFIPRQQVVNYKYAKPDVDVWAAAACLYNMLTGQVPREFRRGKDVWQTVLYTDPVPILRRNPSIPKRLAEVIDRALIDKPDIQFKTATVLKRELEGAL